MYKHFTTVKFKIKLNVLGIKLKQTFCKMNVNSFIQLITNTINMQIG